MFNRRVTLNRPKDIDKLLAEHAAHLDKLLWYVEVKWPCNRTASGRAQLLAASHPGKWIPMIWVGADPAVSREYAELLLEFFKASNQGQGFEFGLGLIDVDKVADYSATYEWGAVEWDCVCKLCGGVFQSTNSGAARCAGCIQGAQREPRRKVRQ